jgi:hypothetical protein
MSDASSETRRFLPEALAWLSGEGRGHGPDELLTGLYERFRSAGREKLADLVYEMAKACLAALPDVSVRTLLRAAPRPPELVSGELSTLAECLAGTGAPEDLGMVSRVTPPEEQALADAARCLEVLERLEGASGRHQLALAILCVHQRRPERAEPILRALLEGQETEPEIARLAEVNLAFALLRQARYAEVVPVAEAAITKAPDDPVPWFNLIAAAAELKDGAAFERGVEALHALHAAGGSPVIRSWIEHDLSELGAIAGLASERVSELTRLPAVTG